MQQTALATKLCRMSPPAGRSGSSRGRFATPPFAASPVASTVLATTALTTTALTLSVVLMALAITVTGVATTSSPCHAQVVVSESGDFTGDGELSLPDVIVLLQYLFSGGAIAEFDCDGDGIADPPGSLTHPVGDLNGDNVAGLVDVLLLLNYLYNGGVAPVPNPCLAAVTPVVADGDDWSLPATTAATPNSGFFSEFPSPANDVDLRVLDVTWRQLNPAAGVYATTDSGAAQGMTFPSFDDQIAGSDPFWMRLWTSAVDWAPTWVPSACSVSAAGVDYDGQAHLPIWNPCVWDAILDTYRQVFIEDGLRSDPRLRFVFVPGAFTWCEFDFDIVSQAVDAGTLDYAQFSTWYAQAMQDLVDVFNGENSDTSDDFAHKLVFTGEDFPFGPDSWGSLDDLFAQQAVIAGMGIRTGISELFNFHLNHIPAYGTTIDVDGHMVTDESWSLLSGERVIACENECYNACGFTTTSIEYAVRMSNLKALQMRVNWLYVVPDDSYMNEYAPFYEFVRLSLGKTATTSPDAWVALRRAEDRYWLFDDAHTWNGAPWVRNYERWLVQRDVAPDGMTRDGSEVYSAILDPDNGSAYEGRRTDTFVGQDSIYFDLDSSFMNAGPHPIELKVTYLDSGSSSFHVEYSGRNGLRQTEAVAEGDTGLWRTASFAIADFHAYSALAGGADFAIRGGLGDDIEVRFVRVVRP